MDNIARKLREFLISQDEQFQEVQEIFETEDNRMETIPEMPLEESTYRESNDYELEEIINTLKNNEAKIINTYKEQLVGLAAELRATQTELIETSQEIIQMKSFITKQKGELSKIDGLNQSIAKERGERAKLQQKNERLLTELKEKEAIIAELKNCPPQESSTLTKSSTKYSDASFSSSKSSNGAMVELVKYLQKKDDEVDRLRKEISKLRGYNKAPSSRKNSDIPIPKSPVLPKPEAFYKKKSKWTSDPFV